MSGAIVPLIRDLGIKLCGQNHAPAALLPGKGYRYPLNSWLGGSPTAGEDAYEEINVLALPRTEPRFLGCPAHSIVTAPTARIWGQVVITTAAPNRNCK